jgi:hypothetical protein
MNQNFSNWWLDLEEAGSNWAMDFFDDPLYSQNSDDWNSVSVMMFKPENSLALVDNYCQQVIDQLIAISDIKFLDKCFETFINQVIRLLSLIKFNCNSSEILQEEAIAKDTNGPLGVKKCMFTIGSKPLLRDINMCTHVNLINLNLLKDMLPSVNTNSLKHSSSYLRSCFRLINAKSSLCKLRLFPFLLILAKKNPHGFF